MSELGDKLQALSFADLKQMKQHLEAELAEIFPHKGSTDSGPRRLMTGTISLLGLIADIEDEIKKRVQSLKDAAEEDARKRIGL